MGMMMAIMVILIRLVLRMVVAMVFVLAHAVASELSKTTKVFETFVVSISQREDPTSINDVPIHDHQHGHHPYSRKEVSRKLPNHT